MMAKLQQQKNEDVSAVLIAGPTASGKSALALKLAHELGGEIVNADSMQVYGVLDRLTARPSAEDLALVPHHLYGHVPPANRLFHRHLAERGIRSHRGHPRAREQSRLLSVEPGFTFRALTGGLSDMPAIPGLKSGIRLRARLENEGIEPLHAELARLDPQMAERLRPADRQRILRALEVVHGDRTVDLELSGTRRPHDRRSGPCTLHCTGSRPRCSSCADQ
jgi:tRNA dimethylallyltransferase